MESWSHPYPDIFHF